MPEALKKLLAALSDGKFHTWTELSAQLELQQPALLGLLTQLSLWDVEVAIDPEKGCQLLQELKVLEKEKILACLKQNPALSAQHIEIWDILPSTNDYLSHTIEKRSKKNYACFAEKQTKGKGRQGRSWVSPFAKNIYLSLRWHFSQNTSELAGLSLAVAIAIIEMLKNFGITKSLGIKWPNDVFCEGKKLAGILVELGGEAKSPCYAIIGIGLNIYLSEANAANISQPWTCVQKLHPDPVDRNELAGRLLNELTETLLLFQTQGFEPFLARWQLLDLSLGKKVSLITPQLSLQGIGRGVNQQGHFLLEVEPGLIKSFSNAEVSLRLSTSTESSLS